ncbi:MAG: hypothetical protein QXD62_02110 [Candidatus Woesearchaeota archaeon]
MKGVKILHSEMQQLFKIFKKYIDRDYQFIKETDGYIFPLKDESIDHIPENFKNRILECDFKKRHITLKDLLRGELTEEELNELIASFEIIGDVAIIQVSPKLEQKKFLIAEAVMKINPKITAVYRKISGREGEFRIMNVEFLAGYPHTELFHKENNCQFLLDFSKCYFSSRLSTERKKVYEELSGKVLVMFSGIGPYAIEAAKYAAQYVIGIELNPDAHFYALKNKVINNTLNVTFLLGDVRNIVPNLSEYSTFYINNEINYGMQCVFLKLKSLKEFEQKRSEIVSFNNTRNLIISLEEETIEAIRVFQKEKIPLYVKDKRIIDYFLKNKKTPRIVLLNANLISNFSNNLRKNCILEINEEKDLELLKNSFYPYVLLSNEKLGDEICNYNFGTLITKSKVKYNQFFDYILMPLPKSAHLFLDLALKVSRSGTIIYLYDFFEPSQVEDEREKILNIIYSLKRKAEILEIRKAGDYSPGVFRHLIKIKVLD